MTTGLQFIVNSKLVMICFIPQNSEESSLLSSFEVILNNFLLNQFKCKNPSEFTADTKNILYWSSTRLFTFYPQMKSQTSEEESRERGEKGNVL